MNWDTSYRYPPTLFSMLVLFALIPILLFIAVENQPLIISDYKLDPSFSFDNTGLSSGTFYQHYYSTEKQMFYSCISEIELTADECLAQQNNDKVSLK